MANKDRYRELLEFTYGPTYDRLRWITPPVASMASMLRGNLLNALDGLVEYACNGSKLIYRDISPGCRHCMNRTWSCLFINNKCNADCFFCPSEQNETELPSSVALYFKRPDSYASYCEKLGITGASISGGEPFLTPKRTLAYLKACKKRMGSDFYFWLYTNGSHAKVELMQQLADAGLDEIRFNIAAWRYSLKMIRRAVGIVPNVTVEVPAIPEDVQTMKETMLELADMGVNYLNLHQMRMTTYNCSYMADRNYHLLEGQHPSALESELAALELMLFAAENELPLAVNYCSFIYRNRSQRAAVQGHAARFCAEPWEDVTETGLIRSIVIDTDSERLVKKCADLDGEHCRYDNNEKKLFLGLELYKSLNEELPVELVYFRAALSEMPVNHAGDSSRIIKLDGGKDIQPVREKIFSANLESGDVQKYIKLVDNPTEIVPEGLPWDEILFSEFTEHGLQEY
ncbi:MAG: radical SAM protein [Leptospirales bacterium]|nr:radical SAM protein [Leptospirales bacterium]